MIELPEAFNLADQINKTISGKRIAGVESAHTPHKLAWYYGDRSRYSDLLTGQTIGRTVSCGGLVEIKTDKANILLGEGVGIRFHCKNEPRQPKHQLLIEFEDGSALSAAVQMYGGMGCFRDGELDNRYYQAAKEKPSPLAPEFDQKYFEGIVAANEVQKLSLKALLATEQRIPGLGNGVLQDILFNARMHSRKKVNTLSGKEQETLFIAIKTTLNDMATQGGRDTELDLFGHPGNYKTILCNSTVNKPCPICGTSLEKETYMGGSIYFCPKCQSA